MNPFLPPFHPPARPPGAEDYFMTSYVEEAAKTSLCRVTSGGAAVGEGCTEREAEYAAKMASKKDTRELERQLARLEAMGTKAMKPELKGEG